MRQLRAVHEELDGYRQLLGRFQAAAAGEYEGLVAAARPELGPPFFAYLDICIKAAHVRNPLPAATQLGRGKGRGWLAGWMDG